jgi:cytochrome c peroxidase
MFGQAIAELEVTLTFANAPIDRFARGHRHAMSRQQKRGALIFFGKAGCVQCHAVAGSSNEMFSGFQMHTIGIPQIATVFGVGTGNFSFSGPNADEDFGLEEFTGDTADRYRFRTSPLRNLAMQPALFHDGCFTRLEDAVVHHLNVRKSLHRYDALEAGLAPDLTLRQGPSRPVLRQLDTFLQEPTHLSRREFEDLVAFLRESLLDPRATPGYLRNLVPPTVPSGMPVLQFEF